MRHRNGGRRRRRRRNGGGRWANVRRHVPSSVGAVQWPRRTPVMWPPRWRIPYQKDATQHNNPGHNCPCQAATHAAQPPRRALHRGDRHDRSPPTEGPIYTAARVRHPPPSRRHREDQSEAVAGSGLRPRPPGQTITRSAKRPQNCAVIIMGATVPLPPPPPQPPTPPRHAIHHSARTHRERACDGGARLLPPARRGGLRPPAQRRRRRGAGTDHVIGAQPSRK